MGDASDTMSAPLRRLFRTIIGEHAGFASKAVFAALAASATGVLGGVAPLAIGLGVHALVPDDRPDTLSDGLSALLGGPVTTAIGLSFSFALVLAGLALSLAMGQVAARLAADTASVLRVALMQKAISASPAALAAMTVGGAPPPPPGIATKSSALGHDAVRLTIVRDSAIASELVVALVTTLPQAVFALVVLSVDLLRSGAGIAALGGAIVFFASRLVQARASSRVAERTRELASEDAAVFAEVREKLAHVDSLFLSGARAQAMDEFRRVSEASAEKKKALSRALAMSGQVAASLGATAPLFVLAALAFIGDRPSASDVARLMLSVPLIIARLGGIDALRVAAIEKRPVLSSIERVLALPSHPPPAAHPRPLGDLVDGSIAFRGVSCLGDGGRMLLRDLTLEIPTGKVVAICGASGSGKTTLLRLLLRLVPRSAGEIIVGGVDVDAIAPDDLPKLFGVQLQETRLLTRSVAENVMLGLPDGQNRKERARLALTKVALHELADDPDRPVNPEAATLSGGEQRRILLARALAKEPRVFVLDEPEAGLAGGQIDALLADLLAARDGATVVIVTHAPDRVESDFNVFLEEGRVVAIGPHETLLENETYATLFARRDR